MYLPIRDVHFAKINVSMPLITQLTRIKFELLFTLFFFIFQRYCDLTDKLIWYQKHMMVHIECLKGEIKNYEDMIGRSDSYCLKKKKIRRSPVRSFVQDSKVNSTTEVTPMNVAPTGLMEGIGATSLRAKSETFDPGQNRIVPRLSKILKRLPLEHLDYRYFFGVEDLFKSSGIFLRERVI